MRIHFENLIRLSRFLCLEGWASSPMAAWLLPLLVGAGIIILFDRQADTHTRLENISIIIEIIFPYGFLILANNLILRERENDQLVFTAVRSRLSWLYLRRFGVLLTAFVLCLSALLFIYHFYYLPIPVGKMLLVSMPVALALGGLSSLVSLAFAEMNAGYLIGTMWWLLCLISSKAAYAILGPHFYLFYFWFTTRENLGSVAWLTSKGSLVFVGFGLILVSAGLLRRQERLVV